jgi:hypothetical protein
MCWIALAPKSELIEILNNQKTRWLDSLWVIDFDTNIVAHAVKSSVLQYEPFIRKNIDTSLHTFAFMHHRKASIWDIHLENSHPFIWSKFILAQNWTSPDFYTTWKDVFHKETDSENLLAYLEQECNTLEECINVLDTIECSLWNIFIFHKWRTLIYSDSTRETFVDTADYVFDPEVEWWESETIAFVSSITNYKPNTLLWYRNWFHIIMNSVTWQIEHEWCYSEHYNQDIFNTTTVHWTKLHKRTQVTKKKEDFEYGSSLDKAKFWYNAYNSIVSKKLSKYYDNSKKIYLWEK